MLVYGSDDYVAAWTAERLSHVTDFGPCAAVGVVSGERLIAGCVYSEYRPRNGTLQMSIASISPMWARRENIAGLLGHAFDKPEIYKVFSATLHTNEKALKAIAHIGFKREAILAHHFGKKQHAVIMRMLRPDFDRLYGATNERLTRSNRS